VVKLETGGGGLRWNGEDHRLGRSGNGVWKAGTFKAIPPPVSVTDRWVGPHEQVLNVPITYWCYGLSKLMYLCHHLAKNFVPYSKAVVREGE
jgi:hypothetical protein